MTHALKTWPEYFKEVRNGNKTFELRKNDRDFNEGERLLLQEWSPDTGKYTGDEIEMKITYVLADAEKFGLKKGFVILGIKPIEHLA